MPDLVPDRAEVEKLLLINAALEGGLVDVLAAESGAPAERVVSAGAAAEEVARRAGTDLRATRILLDALVDIGVAEAKPAGPSAASEGEILYVLSPEARRRLVDPGPDYVRNSLLHQVSKMRGWLDLPHVLREGRPRPTERSEDRLRSFVRTMAEGDPEAMDEVVERTLAYLTRGRTVEETDGRRIRVLDAGGAVGHMALRFHGRGLDAVLCDRPEVLSEARDYLGPSADHIDLLACDFTENLPDGQFDLVYLGNVYHIYGPETNAELTRRVFGRLKPDGVIAIRDFVRGRSPRAAMFAVNMLQATEAGGVWSEAEFRAWLESAGFSEIEILDLERSDNQLILGRKRLG